MCVDEHSGQKTFETASIPPNIKAKQATLDEEGTLTVEWSNDIATGHGKSVYRADWLLNAARPARHHEISTSPHRKVLLWDRARFEDERTFFAYDKFMRSSPVTFKAAMKQLGTTGLIFLRDVPNTEDAIEKIAERIGPLKNTFYGRTWDVKDKPKAENVAYTCTLVPRRRELQLISSKRTSWDCTWTCCKSLKVDYPHAMLINPLDT